MFTALLSPALLPLVLAAGILITSLMAWVWRFPALILICLPLSLVPGQLIRLPLPGQGGGLVLSDVVVGMALAGALGRALRGRSVPRIAAGLLLAWLPFLILSAWLLAVNKTLGISDVMLAGSYWIRLAGYLLLLPALVVLTAEKPARDKLKLGVLIAIYLLLISGLAQFIFYPNLSGANGWDPHLGRLFGTWLDPNFMGAFLIMAAAVIAAELARTRPKKIPLLALLALIIAAIILTRSRATLMALAFTLLLGAPLVVMKTTWTRRRLGAIVLAVSFLFVLAGSSVFMLGERAAGLFRGDATVRARGQALARIWPLAASRSLAGVGYNAYQFAAKNAGLIGDFSIHSRGGADNSWLTLWVTTGLAGLLLFAAPWLYISWRLLINWLRDNNAYALSAFLSLAALGVHSQFINSFLYAHLLLMLVISVALGLSRL